MSNGRRVEWSEVMKLEDALTDQIMGILIGGMEKGRKMRKDGGMAAGGSEEGIREARVQAKDRGHSAEEQFEMLDKEKIMWGHMQGWRNDFIDSMVDMERMVMRYREALTSRKIRKLWERGV